MANQSQTFTFNAIPRSVEELKALPECDLQSPFKTCALTMLVLLNYENDVQATIDMLNVLKGPEPMNPFQTQFLRDRLVGKYYVPKSFFAGTSPANNYEPSMPLTITVSDNPYSYPQDGYATLWLQSSGADSLRPIRTRLKPSTGQWFLLENQALSDIRVPANSDPWA